MGSGLGDGALRDFPNALRSPLLCAPVDGRDKEVESGLVISVRCGSEAEMLVSSLGALGAVPYGRSRSSESSRFAGTVVLLFKFRPGLTHCMLLGGPPRGILGEKPERSAGGYIGGLTPIGLLRSALGPVGIFAGKLFGEVLLFIIEGGPLPLVLLEPTVGCIAPGDASRDELA